MDAPATGMLDFVSPVTQRPLHRRGDAYVSDAGERFPVVRGVARFVTSDSYAKSFGLQWKAHARTQLDSHSGTQISHERLERCLGRPIEALRGRRVLEAGGGAGRFTELLVAAGAWVHTIDLSVAVEANVENIGERANYRIAQADLLNPPYPREAFHLVLCLGVLQHLPSPEAGVRSLWRMVEPGGWLVIDHYRWPGPMTPTLKPVYRAVLKRMRPDRAKRAVDRMASLLFPLHWALRQRRPFRGMLGCVSPCLTYFDQYPELSREQHYEWTRLDTFDALTDRYKHRRTVGQIRRLLESQGGECVWAQAGGNGVEARARKPMRPQDGRGS